MTLAEVERKLNELEKEIEHLKRPATTVEPRSGKWYVENSGKFKDDPVYAKISKLGQKYRKSLRPQTRRGKKQR